MAECFNELFRNIRGNPPVSDVVEAGTFIEEHQVIGVLTATVVQCGRCALQCRVFSGDNMQVAGYEFPSEISEQTVAGCAVLAGTATAQD